MLLSFNFFCLQGSKIEMTAQIYKFNVNLMRNLTNISKNLYSLMYFRGELGMVGFFENLTISGL